MKTTMNNTLKTTLHTLALSLALAASAHTAQALAAATASHTWVSSTGVDANNNTPCTRTAPCKTFQGALQETAPGGLISVVDSGDYGPASISQSVTIDGTGSNATITIPAISVTGIPINGAAIAVVTLRHLTLAGASASAGGPDGIAVSSGSLLVDDCKITGFSVGLNISGAANVVVKNTTITNCGSGISANSGGGNRPGLLSLRDDTIQGCQYGILVDGGPGQTDLSRCTISQNSTQGLGGFGGGSLLFMTATGCTISGNGTGVTAGDGATVSLNDNDVWNNGTGFFTSGSGIIATAGNNRKAGNGTPGAPTPGATVLVQ